MAITMKRVLSVSVALIALSGCAGRAATPSSPTPFVNAKTYTNAKYRFSVTYDSKVFSGGGLEFEGVFNGMFSVRNKSRAGVYLFAVSDRQLWLRLGQYRGPANLRRALAGYVHQFSPGTTHGPVKPVVLDGAPGFETHATGGGMTFDAYVVRSGPYVYTIAPASKTKDWGALEPTMNTIVRAFRVSD